MGGGNPLKKLEKETSKALDNRWVKAGYTGGLSEAVRPFEKSDTIKAMTGRETSMEKSAKAEQAASLLTAKNEADTALTLRKSRMAKKDRGRASLLSGTELGLSSTLG